MEVRREEEDEKEKEKEREKCEQGGRLPPHQAKGS